MNYILLERLAGPEREDVPLIPHYRSREPQTRRFQVALKANLHPSDGVEPRRIYDRPPNGLLRSAGSRRLNMISSGPVTPLAIDAFRQPYRKLSVLGV